MLGEMVGIKPLAATLGASFSALSAVALVEHQGAIETVLAGGLGAGLSVILVRWLLGQYNSAVMRLSKLEDERAAIIRETVQALTRATDQITCLVDASKDRGKEVAELIYLLKERPCICHKLMDEMLNEVKSKK